MIKFKQYALLLLAAVVVFGCSKYDDTELRNDVSDLQSRVEKLEKWCETANGQITSLQGLVTALQANDYVTGVTPVMEGTKEVGYTINFAQSKPITIMHGKDGVGGANPIIGVKKDTDGLYYWTQQIGDGAPTWMTDGEGNKIRTTGDKGADGTEGTPGHKPELSVEKDGDRYYWKVDGEWLMVDERKVPATGEKGETGAAGSDGAQGAQGAQGAAGDSFFKSVTPDAASGTVVIKLANDTEFTLPMLSTTVSFDAYTPLKIAVATAATDVKVMLSATLKKADFAAIKADITNVAGTNTAITRSAAEKWAIALTAPTFKEDGTLNAQPTMTVTVPATAAEDETALLKVTVVDSKGNESSSTRVLYYNTQTDVTGVTLDVNTLTVKTGKTGTLTATVAPDNASKKTVVWTTSNAAIATVADGVVTGVKAGTATITATTEDGGFTATCAVTIENIALTGITLKTATTINKGATEVLTPTFAPADATDKAVTWESSNPSVATVDATGKVTAVAVGEANITVTTTDGNFTQTCKVTVTDSVYFENEGEAGIDGSSWEKAYAIKTKQQLVELSNRVNGSQTSNWNAKYYKLIANIDLGANNTDIWNSIGDGYKAFKGHFDGGNHAVTGKLIASASATYFGIFGFCIGAEIKDLHFNGTIDASAVKSQSAIIGSIAGRITLNPQLSLLPYKRDKKVASPDFFFVEWLFFLLLLPNWLQSPLSPKGGNL